jgi:hypothetical protein
MPVLGGVGDGKAFARGLSNVVSSPDIGIPDETVARQLIVDISRLVWSSTVGAPRTRLAANRVG